MWQVTNQEQTVVKRKDRLQNINKTNVTAIIDGINTLSPTAVAKGKPDILFTVNFPSILVI